MTKSRDTKYTGSILLKNSSRTLDPRLEHTEGIIQSSGVKSSYGILSPAADAAGAEGGGLPMLGMIEVKDEEACCLRMTLKDKKRKCKCEDRPYVDRAAGINRMAN